MAVRNTRKKMTARKVAAKARKQGFKATVFKKEGGYGVSVTRK